MIKSRIPLEKFVKEYSVRNKLNEDIPVYSVTNSQGFCTEYFSKEVASQDKTTYKIVPRGYFAYNPSRINVGSVDWQKYEDRVIVSPLYNVFSVSDEIDCQYLYYFFRSNIGRQMIKAKSSGSVRDNLKIEMLKEMTIPDISMREQQFCSSVLDKLQILIKLKFDEIKQMDELVKARFVEMFGDPVINSKNLATKELKNVMALKAGDFTVASDILDEPS
ncbi:MAG: restriction endonuclease subunit S, partial [Veillonellaceae bacterium]|nr:restriction endonuclease subunit S [Veillonellaceae bacterium]